MNKAVRLLIPALILFSVFYLSPGCTKTTVQHIYQDTVIYRDTVILDSNLDKQVMLSFDGIATGSVITTPALAGSKIYKFNKHNYPGVDSIIFMANPNLGYAGSPTFDQTDSCVVTLFNVTDNVPIAGGQFRTKNTDNSVFVQTGNLYKALPDKEITLGVTVQSTKDETGNGQTAAQVGVGYIFLFRK